ncbi:hypothetical protein Tco_0737300 [Tanacetum coccineum]
MQSLREGGGTLETVDPQDCLGSLVLEVLDSIILTLLLEPTDLNAFGFDPLALVIGFTPVEVNKGLLESLVLRESVCLGILLEEVPNLAYVVSRLGRYTSNPSVAHWKAMTRVLHYLRYSRDYGLHYNKYPAVIEGYSDANWISDIKDSRSTSGYVFIIGGAAKSWKHIRHRHNSIRQLLSTGVISFDYVKSKDNIADPLMKGLSRELVRWQSILINVTAPVNITGAPVTNTVANLAEKPKKFNGHNFKRWQHKMFFYLTTLNLAQFLNETAPQVEPPAKGQPSNAQAVQAVEAWKHSDFLCHNYVQDLQVLLHDIHAEGMTVSEAFQVAAIIEKGQQAGSENTYAPNSAKANMVEHVWSSSKSNSKAKGKGKKKNDKKGKGKVEYLLLKLEL